MGRFLRNRRAASLYVEGVITFPIVIILFLGVINAGEVIFAQSAVLDAARYGARMGSVAQLGQGAALAVASAQTTISKVTFLRNVKVSILAPGGVAGSIIKIRVTADVDNLLGKILPGTSDLWSVTGESTFRQEGW